MDALAIFVAGVAALLAYADVDYVVTAWRVYLLMSVAGASAMVLLGWASNLYRVEVLGTAFLRPWQAVGTWLAVLFGLLGAVFFFHNTDLISRIWVAGWLGAGAVGLGAARILLRARIARWRAQGRMRQRVLLVGAPQRTAGLAQRLENTALRDFYEVTGSFHDNPDTAGGLAAVVPFLRLNTVEAVIICVGSQQTGPVNDLTLQLSELPIEVLLCPDYTAFTLPVTRAHQLDGLSLLQISRPPLGDWARIVKGLEDRIIAVGMLVFLAPLMLLAALAIKLDSRGPVLFRQQRFGFNNRPISVLKFRSMHSNLGDATGSKRTVKDDPRVTRVGRLLRVTSIDELPQLLNVLRGEMSLVGPRAHPITMRVTDRLYHEAVDGYAGRHRVKPGITGLAQINGCRGEVDTMQKAEARIRYDLEYVSRWSLWLDLKIMLLTPVRALKAY